MAADTLKLQVVLSALDKAAAPLRRIQGGAIGAGRELKAARDRLKELNAQQKDISAWRTQRAAAVETEAALAAARQKVQDLGQAMAATVVPTKQMTRDLKAAIREATTLKQKHTDNQVQLQGMRNKLAAVGISTRNLSDAERDLRSKIASTNQVIGEQGRRLERITQQNKRLAKARAQYDRTQQLAGGMAGAGAGAAAAGAAMGVPVLAAAKSYISFEDAMLGVAKQVDGARDDSGQLTSVYYEMGNSIKAMAERIPMATTEIAALVEGAARMGVQGKDNLLGFAKVAANAATAFELPADQIGENLARIAGLYKLPIANVDQLGDAINYLDDNAQSKGGDIIDVLQRTAGITASVGMSFKDAAALGSTFLSLGATAEVAATATNAMIRELAIAGQQPKRFQKGLKALGLEADVIQSGMAKNSTKTLQSVLDAINKLPQSEQLTVTTQLFGKEFGDDAAKLAANMGEYRRQLELANSEAGKGSMQREADIRAESLSARLQMAQNRAFNLSATLGETLRPAIIRLIEGFNRIIEKVTKWVEANPELAYTVLKVVAGLAAMATVFGTVTLGLASLLGPFAMFRYALALTSIKGVSAFGMLWRLGKVALPVVAQAILWIGRALMMNPIGLAITAIALAALLIYKYWDPIKAYVMSLWAEIKAGFDGGLVGILGLIANFSPIGMFYRAFAAVMNYFGFEMPGKFTEFGAMLMQGMVTGITNGLAAVKNAITGAGESTINWFKEKLGIHSPSRVFASLGGFTMAGLVQGLAGGEGDVLGQITNTARRLTEAGAGMLGAGGGLSIDTRAPIQASGGGVVVQGDTVTFNIQATPGTDVAGLRQMLNQLLDERERSKAARVRSRLGDRE
ncbi:phage tail tape measure protein [Pseudomonas tohonis]|nr:phage tail tape measure protein [Pseudomonas tohonis]